MSHRGATPTPPEVNCDRAAVPSPAQDALLNNLSLARKKSWLSSARYIMSRGTSHNKDHVESIKGDDTKAGDIERQAVDGDGIVHNQNGSDHAIYTTPFKPISEPQRAFTPRGAISSLRQHFPLSSLRNRRPALAEITSNETKLRTSPQEIEGHKHDKDELSRGHFRSSSAAKSLVGSIRRISRATTARRPLTTTPDRGQTYSSRKDAATVPLPASPINIQPPPVLKIDLGPAALVSPTFGRSPSQSEESELMRATDPAGFGRDRLVPTYHTRLPGEGPSDYLTTPSHAEQKHPLQPNDLLQLPVDEFGFSVPSGPSTPMPGTDQALRLDGNNEASELFERSVEFNDQNKKKEVRKLKKMISLDAMAEAYVSKPLESRDSSLQGKVPSDQLSLITIGPPWPDMPVLSRKIAHLQTPSAGHRDPMSGQWTSEDPFAPGNVVGDLAQNDVPSGRESIKLPFRPKITVQHSDSKCPITLADSIPSSYQQLADACKAGEKATAVSATHRSMENNEPQPLDLESREYDEFKTQHLFGDLRENETPEYEEAAFPRTADPEASPTSANSVAEIYQRISQSQMPHPQRARAGTTHSADVGDVFWKFSMKDWMQGSEEVHTGRFGVHPSPQRRSTEKSLDSVSIPAARAVSATCAAASMLEAAPSMGNRLEFELKRSQRNKRYNELSDNEEDPVHESCARDPTAAPSPPRPNLRIVTDSFKKKRNGDFDEGAQNARPSSQRPDARYSAVSLSSDSIEHDLKDAITEHYIFQAAMSGNSIEGPYSSPLVSETEPLLSGFDDVLKRHDSLAVSPVSSESSHVSPLSETRKSSTIFFGNDGYANEYIFRVDDPKPDPKPELPVKEDTLDECLEMFQHYNKSQQIVSSDDEGLAEEPQNPFSSPSSGYRADSSSVSPESPSKRPLPSRYHSRKNRR